MLKNEIKKELYKQKPLAMFVMVRKFVAYYTACLENETIINFEIPCDDMGDADFLQFMDAKLLIRYLVI